MNCRLKLLMGKLWTLLVCTNQSILNKSQQVRECAIKTLGTIIIICSQMSRLLVLDLQLCYIQFLMIQNVHIVLVINVNLTGIFFDTMRKIEHYLYEIIKRRKISKQFFHTNSKCFKLMNNITSSLGVKWDFNSLK